MSGIGAREAALAELSGRSFDVLVIGGGITGAGIALELAGRGRSCALVEARDFASGTSSRSSKLIHGGLRYLARGELAIVRDSLRERRRLLAIAPRIVRPMPYLFPAASIAEELRVRTTVSLYERLAGDDGLPAHRWLPPDEVAARYGGYGARASRGAALYWEGQADDVRLTLAVLRAAAERGAALANHVRCESIQADRGRAVLVDDLSGREIELRARLFVVAVGVWLARAAAKWTWPELEMRPSRGIHVVLGPAEFELPATVVARHPDGRYLSLMPWHGRVLAGTTDTPAGGESLARPVASRAEVGYVLDAIGASVASWRPIVRAAWAGLRPLLGGGPRPTVAISREERLLAPTRGVIAIAGGKLTTFGAIARRVRELVDDQLGSTRDPGEIPLDDPLGHGAGPRLVEGMPYTTDDLLGAFREEMATSLVDAVAFRLGIAFVAPDVADERADVWAAGVAPRLGWDERRARLEADTLRSHLNDYRPVS